MSNVSPICVLLLLLLNKQKNNKLELRMFTKHKPHASRRQRALPSPRHPPAATEWCRLLLAAYGARLTSYNALSMGWLSSFSLFVSGDLDLWPLTLTFKIFRASDQTRLPCEFGANPFSGSRDIWVTNKKRKFLHKFRMSPNQLCVIFKDKATADLELQ